MGCIANANENKTKHENPIQLVNTANITGPNHTCTRPDDSKTYIKVKSSEGSGIESDQTEQLHTDLTQVLKVLNKNQGAKKVEAFTTSKRDNRYPSPLDSQETKAAIVMAKKKVLIYPQENTNPKLKQKVVL